jgi:hypothetical protein
VVGERVHEPPFGYGPEGRGLEVRGKEVDYFLRRAGGLAAFHLGTYGVEVHEPRLE